MKPFKAEKVFEIETDLEEAWEIISDTNALNRAIGLPTVTYQDNVKSSQGITRRAEAKFLGTHLTWDEYPFEWVRKQYFSVLRHYDRGFLRKFWGGIQIAPHPKDSGRTMVKAFAYFQARSLWTAPIVFLISKLSTSKTQKYIAGQVKARNAVVRTRPRHVGQSKPNHQLLDKITADLLRRPNTNKEAVKQLNSHLKHAADENIISMRPYEYADNWGMDRLEVLKVFLTATRKGILNMEWVLICPSCRVPKAEFATLANVKEVFHCDFCDVDYTANLDQSTELRFNPNPRIRKANTVLYCVGNPSNFPHIASQISIQPGTSREIALSSLDYNLCLRAARKQPKVTIFSESNTSQQDVKIGFTQNGFDISQVNLQSGAKATIEITNQTEENLLLFLEERRQFHQAATALDVAFLDDFRKHFSHEVLSSGCSLGVEHITLMFTDLTESTALYERIGDGQAYGLVSKHFEFLKDVIASFEGKIVKTIGDAVMASFEDPIDAVRAAFQMQQEFGKFMVNNSIKEVVSLKIGIHEGPAIAVNANNQIDFFGQSVNLAARSLNASKGEDVVITREVLENDRVNKFLSKEEYEPEEKFVELKGFDDQIPLYRVQPRKPLLGLTEIPSFNLKIKKSS